MTPGKSRNNDFEGRRRVPRRSFDAAVGLLLAGEYEIARSYQVGEGGMMVSCSRPMEMGRNIAVSFYVPGGGLVMVRGIVRSVIPPKSNKYPVRYGIEFLNLGFQSKREIRNFVAAATRVDGQLFEQKSSNF